MHLSDSAGFLAGQRDTYPGMGLLATSDLSAEHQWVDRYVVPVHESAYAPEELTVRVGLYDFETEERMTLLSGEDTVTLDEIDLVVPEGITVPNSVSVNFGDEMRLLGYFLERRILSRDDTLSLTLFWEAVQQMDENYTISVQILGQGQQSIGQNDSWPHSGDFPTSTWQMDDLIGDRIEIDIATDAAPGVYDVQIVVYRLDGDGTIQRLARITDDRRIVDDFMLLTEVRVLE